MLFHFSSCATIAIALKKSGNYLTVQKARTVGTKNRVKLK